MNESEKELTPEEQKKAEAFRQRALRDKRIEERMAAIKHKIIVASGKGGVGKSSFAVNVAAALAERGYTVGFYDGDIHGPAAAKFFGIHDPQLTGDGEAVNPVVTDDGIRVMSMAFLLEEPEKAVIWRGPIKMQMIDTLLADVNWGELDFLIIDTPPGTGDEILSLAQRIKDLDGVVMITTPQSAAVNSAVKTITFAKSVNAPVLGVVENMGPFACPDCGAEIKLFGSGGGEKAALSQNVPFLGTIPFDPVMGKDVEAGRATVIEHRDAPSAAAVNGIVDKLLGAIEPAAK
jgi:ATP-binding protein involved in chromosome partitioning